MNKLILGGLIVISMALLSSCASPNLYRYSNTRDDIKNKEGDKIKLTVTGYCMCKKCCDWTTNRQGQKVVASGPKKGTHKRVGYTSSGTRVKEGTTIAADISKFPYGTRIDVPGWSLGVVEDTGKDIKGNHIDVYFNSHTEAVNWGKQELEVTVYYLKDKKKGEIFPEKK